MNGVYTSLSKYVHACVEGTSFTPDVLHINHHLAYVPVFMYGCEKQGYSEADFMEDYPVYGKGFTCARIFTLYVDNRHTPVMLTNPLAEDSARVAGDLYLVPDRFLFKLDARYNNGLFYRRGIQQIRWYSPDQKDQKAKEYFISEAYVYTGVQDFWKEKRANKQLTTCVLNYPTQAPPYYNYRKGDDAPNVRDRRAL